MTNRTPFRPKAVRLAAAMLAAALWTTAAHAVDVAVPVLRGPAATQGDLQALQDRLSRQQFQAQQQRYRQDERDAVPMLKPRLDVPRVKPGCRIEARGSQLDCR